MSSDSLHASGGEESGPGRQWKTGDVFYFETHTAFDGKTHGHKCRVLFVGTENLFYDAWWEALGRWTFVPVRKGLAYYRVPMKALDKLANLRFEGFEAIDEKSLGKLYVHSPEVLLRTTKEAIRKGEGGQERVEVHADAVALIPIGPKGGVLKAVQFDGKGLTRAGLMAKVLEIQNLDYIETSEIVLQRVGLEGGVPSYVIQTVWD